MRSEENAFDVNDIITASDISPHPSSLFSLPDQVMLFSQSRNAIALSLATLPFSALASVKD